MSRYPLQLIILVFLFATIFAQGEQVITLKLPDTLYVKQVPLRLGDLLGSGNYPVELQNIVVVQDLSIGGRRLLTSDLINSYLKRNPVLASYHISLEPGRILLYRPYKEVKISDFQKELERYISDNFRQEHFATSIELDSPERTLRVPEGPLFTQFSHFTELKNGKNSLLMSITNGNDYNVNLALTVTLRTWDQVPVAKRLLDPGTKLKMEDVNWEIRETTYIPFNNLIRKGELVENSKVLYQVRSNTVLTRDQLRTPPLIKRGSPVTIIVEKGAIKITAPGVALQNGNLNDLIWVKNKHTKKRLKARIVDKDKVLIQSM